MTLIPPGKLIIITEQGSNKIAVKKFFLDRFEVTQKDYKNVIGKNFSFFKDKQLPVEKVN